MSPITIPVSFTVVRVGNGGNVCEGQYFYNFTPYVVNITKPGTVVEYRLSEDTPEHFKITGLFACYCEGNLSNQKISKDGRVLSIRNSNATHQLIMVSLQVRDEKAGMTFTCDPQMTNTPGTGEEHP